MLLYFNIKRDYTEAMPHGIWIYVKLYFIMYFISVDNDEIPVNLDKGTISVISLQVEFETYKEHKYFVQLFVCLFCSVYICV